MYTTDSQWAAAACHRELSLLLCDDLDDGVEGVEGGFQEGEGYVCTYG